MAYQPPFKITTEAVNLIAQIAERFWKSETVSTIFQMGSDVFDEIL